MSAFTLDITTDPQTAFNDTPLTNDSADVASLMFVLSALKPEDFRAALENARNVLKPGGVLILRDYAVNDMAMFRFGPGTKERPLMTSFKGNSSTFLEVIFDSLPTFFLLKDMRPFSPVTSLADVIN